MPKNSLNPIVASEFPVINSHQSRTDPNPQIIPSESVISRYTENSPDADFKLDGDRHRLNLDQNHRPVGPDFDSPRSPADLGVSYLVHALRSLSPAQNSHPVALDWRSYYDDLENKPSD